MSALYTEETRKRLASLRRKAEEALAEVQEIEYGRNDEYDHSGSDAGSESSPLPLEKQSFDLPPSYREYVTIALADLVIGLIAPDLNPLLKFNILNDAKDENQNEKILSQQKLQESMHERAPQKFPENIAQALSSTVFQIHQQLNENYLIAISRERITNLYQQNLQQIQEQQVGIEAEIKATQPPPPNIQEAVNQAVFDPPPPNKCCALV